MNLNLPTDWDPISETVQADQIAAYDDMQLRCSVTHDDVTNHLLQRPIAMNLYLAILTVMILNATKPITFSMAPDYTSARESDWQG